MGIEEKNIPFKPNTWYRVEYMFKGIPYMMQFRYPREAPDPESDSDGYLNKIFIDNNFGGGYGFYYVCSECDFVKQGKGNEDGLWINFGFTELPEKCPECGADGAALYRDGDRRPYKEWTLVYEDFRTGDYVGPFKNGVYRWVLVVTGSASAVAIDNFMVYEITGEGGEAVGGDWLTEMSAHAPALPPRPAPIEAAFGSVAHGLAQKTALGILDARRAIAAELGIAVPRVAYEHRESLAENEAAFYLHGREIWRGTAVDAEGLAAAFAGALRKNAHRVPTLDDTHLLLDRAGIDAGALPLAKVHAELLKLLADGKPILDLPRILENLTTRTQP